MKPPAIDTPPHIRLEEIFAQATALPECERATFLDAACAGEPALRAEVEGLLLSHQAGGFMKGAARKADIEAELARLKAEEAGERIGNFKLLEQIGEGGFGTVWMADQERPVRRRVAMKIIKLGMDTKEVIARFEQERQALAMMDHLNIAKVLDAGVTPFGRPFFVMELVRGIKITDYCDQANLSTADRLELFIAVCQAVQHAHQKGIIHRDLKPSNILVTLHDGKPVPKVIDFGVAKATQSQRLTDLTIYTQFEQMIGTPLYMSPEQAEMSGLDIDTRSDIYSLGVLLYELLVGRTPFDPEHLMRQGLDEIRRTIREEEPPKPSTALQTMAAELRTNVARHRQMDPATIAKRLRGDLDWIVMKALEKDRARRYETANGFAEDIRRYLSDKPVAAAAPSVAYLLRKFARRQKAPLSVAALIAVALVSATAISLWQKRLAIAAKKETTDALGKIEEKKAEVDRKNTEQKAMLTEAARSDRLVAEQNLRAGNEREAFAHLARACEYDPLSAQLSAEKAIAALNTWSHPVPKAILIGHTKNITLARFSPDGGQIVTASEDGTARVWDAMTGKSIVTLVGHDSTVRSVEFSPDGTRIVTTSADKTGRLWDAQTGKSLAALVGHDDIVSTAQFSADGTRILTGSSDKTARVWDAATGTNVATISGRWLPRLSADGTRVVTGAPIVTLASIENGTAELWDAATGTNIATLAGGSPRLSPDSHTIVTLSGDKAARLWDATTGKNLATLNGHQAHVAWAEFSPDATRVATASMDKTARLWDAATGKNLATLTGHETGVLRVLFSPDGARIVTVSVDGVACVWDATTGENLARFAAQVLGGGEFSPDGSQILTISSDGSVRVCDVLTGKTLATFGAVDELHRSTIRLSPDGTCIVTAASGDKTARVWDVPTGESFNVFAAPGDLINSRQISFTPIGPRLVTVSREGVTRLWDAATGKYLVTLTGYEKDVTDAQLSPDGTRIVTVSSNNPPRVWDAVTGKSLAMLAGATAQFSADGTRIVTASWDKTVRVWNATGKNLATLAGHESYVTSAQFSPDGARILTASMDKTARIWNAASGKVMVSFANLGQAVEAEFSPDGTRLFTVSFSLKPMKPGAFTKGSSTAQTWDVSTGKNVATLAEHDGGVAHGRFSLDGTRLVTTASDKTARVWDPATGKRLATLIGHEDVVERARFSPDGSRIVTASRDKTARLWDVANGKSLVTLAGHKYDVLDAQFSPDGSSIVTVSKDNTVRAWTILPSDAGPPPGWFPNFLRYLAQMRLNSEGELETLSLDDWLALRDNMRAVRRAGAGQDTPYLSLLRRFVPE